MCARTSCDRPCQVRLPKSDLLSIPIKKDGTGKRWVEMELIVPGTPEQIWHAIATGEGTVAWFVKASIEPQVGWQVAVRVRP